MSEEVIKDAEVLAPEPKKPSLEDLQVIYGQMCQEVGNKLYQLKLLKEDLEELHKRMKDINQQGAALKAEAAK